MKKLSTLAVLSSLLLNACADQMHAHQAKPAQAPTQTNAQMAENLSNAVQRCVGMGLTIGSPLYEACVKNQLK
jgi:hypothetical protein